MSDKPFEYDIYSDPVYTGYKNSYTSQGKKAMEDTIGQASSLSGGYGNSYALTAGAAAYNDSLDKLNDIYPELYSAAYSRYSDELDRLESKLSYLTQRENTEYERYSDANKAYFDELDSLRQFYLDESKKDISSYENEWEAAYKLATSENAREEFDADLAYKYAIADEQNRDRDYELLLENKKIDNQNEQFKAELDRSEKEFDAEMAYKYAVAEQQNRDRDFANRLEDEKLANQNEQFWAEFAESNKEFLREDELYVLLGNGGYYEVLKALDLQYSNPEMARFKALSMNIKKEYVDAYFNSKY